jgi:acyl-coenzyme A thioesterase PaaI-like protein
MSVESKKERQRRLLNKIKEDPFMNDEELAQFFSVSIQTIRLDRMELGLPGVRERITDVASSNYTKLKSLGSHEIVGELIDLSLGKNGISILETTEHMAFERTKIVRGHYIYSLAETLAISVIDAKVALIGVANIKYKSPVIAGARLVAKAEVKRSKANSFIVWVSIQEKQAEVFRGKFILVSIE